MERILEQGQEGLEWAQNMSSHRTSLECTKGFLLYVHTYVLYTPVHTPVHLCVHTHNSEVNVTVRTVQQAAFEAQANTLIFRSTKQERVDQVMLWHIVIFNTLPSGMYMYIQY